MREFEKKRNFRYLRYSYFVTIPLAVVLVFLARGTWNLYLKDREALEDLKSTQLRFEKLKERQKSLTASVEKLSTDSGIESEIRDRLQMAKEGEKEIIIVNSDADKEELEPIQPTFLQKLVNFFTIR